MIRIQVEQLKEAGLTLEFETTASRFPVLNEMGCNRECEFTRPLQTRLKAIRIGEMVEIEGEVHTTIRLTCGRCLREFSSPLEFEFALTYTRSLPGALEADPEQANEADAEEAGLIIFRGDVIDLTEGIQEQVILALPLRPLCSETCKGLCPTCGADLNHGNCRCSERPAAGPFAALGRIRLEKE